MASGPFVDIASLLAPIPGDSPAGAYPIPFDFRQKLDEARSEVLPDPDDRMAPEPKKADWPGAAKAAQQVLKEVSKDLLTAARLTEALAKQHSFAGLRDGLRLMREMVEQCWDRLNPPIEDGDVEVRSGPFYWLDDAVRGAKFPTTLKLLPLLAGVERSYSWQDWRDSQDGKGSVSREEFEKAILNATREQCETVATALDEVSTEAYQLVQALAPKLGQSAPGLGSMRQVIEDCRRLAHQILERKPKPVEETPVSEGGGGGAGPAADGSPRGAMRTRAEVFRQLAQAANVLKELEPHSPIPYLIERAVTLGHLSYPDLMKVLVRDVNVLSELNRELGIEEPTQ